MAVRSENISIWREPKSPYYIQGIISEKSFVGGMLRIVVTLNDGTQVVVSRQGIILTMKTEKESVLSGNRRKLFS